jgi:hypothetical protein
VPAAGEGGGGQRVPDLVDKIGDPGGAKSEHVARALR